jgi:GMP synthase-like glutamine amidotransferase
MSVRAVTPMIPIPAEAPSKSPGLQTPPRWRQPHEPARTAAVIQHQENVPAGLLLDLLAARGLAPRIVRMDRREPLPDPRSIALAVSLGSDGSVNDAHAGPELEWLREADAAGTAILGVGFGAQALAVALGGAVQPALRSEYGWVRVTSAAPRMLEAGPWLTWHDEAIRLPAGARLLAHNDNGPQAFRAEAHLGVQFHPEVTPEIIAAWVTGRPAKSVDSQAILEGTAREFRHSTAAAYRLLSTFVGAVQGSLTRPGSAAAPRRPA